MEESDKRAVEMKERAVVDALLSGGRKINLGGEAGLDMGGKRRLFVSKSFLVCGWGVTDRRRFLLAVSV